jgi:hypothetical protein
MLLKLGRSTGAILCDKTMVSITIVDGTDHLFTPDILGTHVVDLYGKHRSIKWVVGAAYKGGVIMCVAALPDVVRMRYRLDCVDFVSIGVVPATYFRAFPDKAWWVVPAS